MFDWVRRGVGVASFSFLICVTTASAQDAKFEHLVRPAFTELNWIDGISADGSRVVATFTKNPEGVDRPVAWDAAGTAKLLELLPEPGYAGTKLASFRQPISADGSLIGGYCQTYADPSGFRSAPVSWNAAGSIGQLPDPFGGYVSAVSPNGAFLYGWCQDQAGDGWPYRWTAAGQATRLQTLSGGGSVIEQVIAATSTDGTVAVGTDEVVIVGDGSRNYRPARWKADGSVEALPLLGTDADGRANGQAQLCSGDGSVVVGWVEKYTSTGAFLGNVNVCWPGDGRVLQLSGSHLAMTPDGRTIVGDARFDLVNGQVVTTGIGSTEQGVIYAYDVSDDGRVMAGTGSPRSSHPGALVWVDGQIHDLQVLLAEHGASLPAGWTSLDAIYFCSADGTVFVGEGTFGTERTAFRVTIPKIFVDDEAPVFERLPAVRRFCDPGRPFATVRLKTPEATDDSPGTVIVKTNAGSRFRIGGTNVVWTATDAAGNVSRAIQKVVVINRKPKANAGKSLTVTTSSEKGALVRLNGAVSDPDRHPMRFRWTAKRVRLQSPTSLRTAGLFPVGPTTATLTVIDIGGARDTDTIRVTVKLKNAKRRPRGAEANRSFAAATQHAASAVDTNASGSATLSGLAYASAAAAYGDAVGEFVRWEEGQSEADALPAYAELRSLQATYGQAATEALLSAYAETGDESVLSAYGYAAYGTAYAAADLGEE